MIPAFGIFRKTDHRSGIADAARFAVSAAEGPQVEHRAAPPQECVLGTARSARGAHHLYLAPGGGHAVVPRGHVLGLHVFHLVERLLVAPGGAVGERRGERLAGEPPQRALQELAVRDRLVRRRAARHRS